MAALRDLRENAFLDQQELADLAGLSLSTIQRLESGRAQPRRKTARKLAEILKVDPREIEFGPSGLPARRGRPRYARSPALQPTGTVR
jgi:transcriptional regulator with XRE-family HTH domain